MTQSLKLCHFLRGSKTPNIRVETGDALGHPPPPEEWCRRHPIATFQKASCFKLYWESAL